MKKNLFCYWKFIKHSNLLKLFRIMKLSVFMMLIGVLNVYSGNVFSQDEKITINLKDASIKQVLRELESKTAYSFLYNDELINVERRVNVTVEDETLIEVLDDIFQNTKVIYKIVEKRVILIPSKEMILGKQQQQNFKVVGKVVEKNGDPLPGVNVYEKSNPTHGVITSVDGTYSITVSNEDAILVFSFVGFESQELHVASRKVIDVTLLESSISLNEVVTIGYGTQKKVNLTGAVDVVSKEQIENRPVVNVSSALQGVSPNLNVTTTTRGGEPGAGKNLNIRGVGSLTGNSSPYILVDGVPMNINDVNPNDIESMSILKDAAASAIYGARAPYGVILIKTKGGKKGEKIRVSYDNNISFHSPLNLPHMANGLDFATAYNQATANAGQGPVFNDETLERIRKYQAGEITDETIEYPNNRWNNYNYANSSNDWLYIFYKPTVTNQKHDVSIKGGSESTSFYISAGYLDQPGQLNWSDEYYKRYNVTANIKTDVTDWMRFNLNVKFARSLEQFPNAYGGYDRNVLYHNFARRWAVSPLYYPDGQYSGASQVSMLLYGGKDKKETNDLWMTMGGEIEPVKGWKTRVSYSWNNNAYDRSSHKKTVYANRPDGTQYIALYPINQYYKWMANNKYHMFNVTTSYIKELNGHNFNLLIGYEEELKNNSGLRGDKKQLVTDKVPSISTATGDYNVDDWLSHWATQGIFSRFNYNYKEKYLIEFNARYDGSSRFAEDKRWGLFPSGSIGYNISKEEFWGSLSDYVNTCKVRASYGSLGNQNVPNYLYVPILPVRTNLGWIMGSERPVYTTTPGLISPTLTWETVTTFDIGTDLAFLNSRLSTTFDWYKRDTKDMFGPAETLPRVLGASVPKKNNAELSTKGWELSIGWKDNVGNLAYYVRFLMANSNSKVTKYNNPTKTLSTWYEGQTIGDIWGLTTDHIIQDKSEVDDMPNQDRFHTRWGPGDIMYKDLDGNDTIDWGSWTADDHGDYSVIGNSNAHYNYSIMAGLEWKGIDFSMFWQGVGKRDVAFSGGDNMFFGIRGNKWQSTVMEPHLDYWRPADETNELGPNTDAYYPKPYMSSEDRKNKRPQTRYLVSAAYLRLKNIQIGYTIPNRLTQKVAIYKLRIYFSAENLLTFTKLPKLFDPETIYGPWGVGKGHPISRSVSLGLNLTF